MLAMQLLAGAGDEVVAVVPVWPNLTPQPAILGARVQRVALHARCARRLASRRSAPAGGDHAADARAAGQCAEQSDRLDADRDEQRALLEHCRRTGTWIVADEVYERIWFGAGRGARRAFSTSPTRDDRLIVVHSFSKSFLMTGWRLGWMVRARRRLLAQIGKLIEFNTSCAPVFVQRGGLAALAMGNDFVPGLVQRLRGCRDLLLRRPAAAARRDGGGARRRHVRLLAHRRRSSDSLALAKRLVAEHGLGLAPGVAFGAGGRGLAALVLRVARARAAEPGRRAAGAGAAAIIARSLSGSRRQPGRRSKQHGAGRFHPRPQVKPETASACGRRPGGFRITGNRHMAMADLQKAEIVKANARAARTTPAPPKFRSRC